MKLTIITPVEDIVSGVQSIDEAEEEVIKFIHGHGQHDDIDAMLESNNALYFFDFEIEQFVMDTEDKSSFE